MFYVMAIYIFMPKFMFVLIKTLNLFNLQSKLTSKALLERVAMQNKGIRDMEKLLLENRHKASHKLQSKCSKESFKLLIKIIRSWFYYLLMLKRLLIYIVAFPQNAIRKVNFIY